MPIKFDYYIPKLFSLFLVLMAAGIFTVLVNFNAIEVVSRPEKVITPENIDSELPKLNNDDNVSIKGTINYLRVISDDAESIYYAGLEEFGDKLIVRIPKNMFKGSSMKNIEGTVRLLDESPFSDSLINKLNSKGEIEDINASELEQLDDTVKERIAENLQGNFTNDSVLVVTGTKFERDSVYLETIALGLFSTLFLVILFREKILFS